ncbi:hypothetical protein, partial [Streptomyces rochei]|uniref:hypothetical protein n=1 Tax=Streptomyces rochei TaxID=1928 RepID=UPI0022E9F496
IQDWVEQNQQLAFSNSAAYQDASDAGDTPRDTEAQTPPGVAEVANGYQLKDYAALLQQTPELSARS